MVLKIKFLEDEKIWVELSRLKMLITSYYPLFILKVGRIRAITTGNKCRNYRWLSRR